MQFNKQQLEVIKHKEGACMVLASAGSGKTTVLVQRVKTLIENGVNPEDIAVITFTDNSSKSLGKKFKKNNIENVVMGTFHSLCKRILIKEGVNTSKQLADYQYENELKKLDKNIKYKDVKSFIGYQKSYGLGVNDTFVSKESEYDESTLREMYKTYEDFKKSQKALDLDDWLLLTREILRKNPNKHSFKYIMVDESQDNNVVFNDLARLLCPNGNVMAIGDFRQSIYSFRGSNPELFMNFNKQYPNATIINLSVNYRSTSNIVENSNNFIKQYYGDYEFYEDSISQSKEKGEIKTFTSMGKSEEAEIIVKEIEKKLKQGISPSEITILYRLNQNSFNLENELKRKNIPYFVHSTESNFFNRKEINALMCMLRLIDNPHDNMAYETMLNLRMYPLTFLSGEIKNRIHDLSASKNISYFDASELIKVDKPYQRENLNTFNNNISKLIIQHKKKVGLPVLIDNILALLRVNEFIIDGRYEGDALEERLESIVAFKSFLRDNTLESFLKFVYGGSKSDRKCEDGDIQLMTVHKSKGLEFRDIYLVGIEQDKFPNKKAPLDEESRLFYVATTRSKENLYLSQIGDCNLFVEQYFNNNTYSN